LYPDQLLVQTLAAATYPLQLVELQQWLAKNPGLKDKALADAVAKQPWDPTVQAMAALPDLVKRLTDNIQWTTNLGNAFLSQQSDVMDAVQRMRQKAEMTGALKSTPQQAVQTESADNKQVIVIQQADPQVVYVPSYDPLAVYGPAVYPYPPIAYPSWGYAAGAAAISFGAGVAMGAAFGGGWGWNANWGHNDVQVNNFNNFNRNANINANRAGNINANRSGTWQHNPASRGGAPYGDRATADRFGGAARGDSLANREASARQQLAGQGGNARSGAVGTSGLGDRGGAGGLGDRAGGGNVGARGGDFSGLGGGDRIGSSDLSRGGGGGAFGGGADRFSGASARDSGSRGASSFGGGGFGGGGRGFGGGGFGGGARGGGRR